MMIKCRRRRMSTIRPSVVSSSVIHIVLWLTILSRTFGNASANAHHHHQHQHHQYHPDYRIIHHDELKKDVTEFHSEDVRTFSQMIIDFPRYQLIVGARNYLFRLSLDGLHPLQQTEWVTKETSINICLLKGQSADDCQNFIMVLLAHNNSVFACGTNAFNPICSWRQISDLDVTQNTVSGIGKCPYNPHQNITALISGDGDYYIGTMVDFSARDPAIYRIMGNSPLLRTTQYNFKWLSDPDFVGSFEIDHYIYFFFRETATEYINCGKTIYSRVARLCKNDKGGQYMLKDNWTTFLKARLNCSIPGEYPFYYNEIQSVFYLEHDQMMYATFTTPVNSIYGSAICAFSMSDISKAFEGAFKYQRSSNSAWERVRSSHSQYECEAQGNNTRPLASDKYQLMDEAVQPVHDEPVYTEELERFSHIVVDVVATKVHDRVHVLYVATADGLIKKLVILPRTQKTCLVEVLHIFPKNQNYRVRQMKILKVLHSLYLGTDISVLKLPMSRCERFTTKKSCLDAMDPYCGWNMELDQCTMPIKDDPLNNNWEQNVLSCPIVDNPVNGGWGAWSKWSACPQLGLNAQEQCLCRTRHCDSPHPAFGGNNCEGSTNEVANCTRDGQWTEWSSWSSCSQTCGMAVRTRKRICGNPAPAFGGKQCNGSDKSEIYCASNPPCPTRLLPPIDGQWSQWSSWDDCSAPCNRGIQARRRRCDSPSPQNGGRDCTGCNVEYQDCNRHSCQEERRSSHWTPWLIHNFTKDGHYQQRFRFVCRAHVPDSRMIRVGLTKTEERFCTSDGVNCIDKAYIGNDGDWSEWSTWSPCSAHCGGGSQHRKRACDNPRPSGGGSDCMGESREERACNLQPCSENESAFSWTPWSECDDNNYQHRHSICPPEEPVPCEGTKEESRPCDYPETAPTIVHAGSTGMGVGNVIFVCLLCFIIGGSLGALAMHFYNKKWRRRRRIPPQHLERKNSKRQATNNMYQQPIKNNQYSMGSLRKNQQTSDFGPKRPNRTSSFNMVSEQDKYG